MSATDSTKSFLGTEFPLYHILEASHRSWNSWAFLAYRNALRAVASFLVLDWAGRGRERKAREGLRMDGKWAFAASTMFTALDSWHGIE